MLQQLWAPWRLQYIVTSDEASKGGCFLCRYRDSANDDENYVVSRGKFTMTVLNRYPYNNGHLLVAPQAHKADLTDLTADEHAELMEVVTQMRQLLGEIMQPEGFNIGLNLGKIAGAGLPGHLHWHIVPRWAGDTNFMSVVSDTTVIPQSLDALFQLLKEKLGN